MLELVKIIAILMRVNLSLLNIGVVLKSNVVDEHCTINEEFVVDEHCAINEWFCSVNVVYEGGYWLCFTFKYQLVNCFYSIYCQEKT